MTKQLWNVNEQSIMEEAIEFNQFIINQSVNPLYGIIFFLILGTTDETKILKLKDIENTKIYIMETNSRFVDGGECFMGDNANEMLLINSILDDLISF
jgi:hypothetical protein